MCVLEFSKSYEENLRDRVNMNGKQQTAAEQTEVKSGFPNLVKDHCRGPMGTNTGLNGLAEAS